jgi:type I restriction enzyme M protein
VARDNNGANLGFEKELWQAADALRSNMDAAEYKHVVLGLIFLKYISDAFEEYHAQLVSEMAQGADPEDPDEYRAANIFWVPQEARWAHLLANARQPTIGKLVDEAMLAIERDNPSLKGVLPKDYAHPRLDKQRRGQLRCWWPCSSPTRAGCMIRAAGRAACLSSRNGSSKPTAGALATSASMARNRTIPPGGWPR